MRRSRWFEVVALLALIACLAVWLRPHPAPNPPRESAPTGILLMSMGDMQPAELESARAHLQRQTSEKVSIGLPYVWPDGQMGALIDFQVLPTLEGQARRAGAAKIACTHQPLYHWTSPYSYLDDVALGLPLDRQLGGFWGQRAVLVSDSGLPGDDRKTLRWNKLLTLAVQRLTGQSSAQPPGTLQQLDRLSP